MNTLRTRLDYFLSWKLHVPRKKWKVACSEEQCSAAAHLLSWSSYLWALYASIVHVKPDPRPWCMGRLCCPVSCFTTCGSRKIKRLLQPQPLCRLYFTWELKTSGCAGGCQGSVGRNRQVFSRESGQSHWRKKAVLWPATRGWCPAHRWPWTREGGAAKGERGHAPPSLQRRGPSPRPVRSEEGDGGESVSFGAKPDWTRLTHSQWVEASVGTPHAFPRRVPKSYFK